MCYFLRTHGGVENIQIQNSRLLLDTCTVSESRPKSERCMCVCLHASTDGCLRVLIWCRTDSTNEMTRCRTGWHRAPMSLPELTLVCFSIASVFWFHSDFLMGVALRHPMGTRWMVFPVVIMMSYLENPSRTKCKSLRRKAAAQLSRHVIGSAWTTCPSLSPSLGLGNDY